MRQVHFITYGNKPYESARRRICLEAAAAGWFDTVEGHSPATLDRDFVEALADVLQIPKGGGYWIWKPFIMYRKLLSMADGDVLVYADAGCVVSRGGGRRFDEYLRMVADDASGYLAFCMDHLPEEWYTNEATFEHFGVARNDHSIRRSGQMVATVQVLRKCISTVHILETALRTLYSNRYLYTDEYNNYHRSECFRDHRHDQSIFSILRKQHGAVVIPDETYALDFRQLTHIPIWAARSRAGP